MVLRGTTARAFLVLSVHLTRADALDLSFVRKGLEFARGLLGRGARVAVRGRKDANLLVPSRMWRKFSVLARVATRLFVG